MRVSLLVVMALVALAAAPAALGDAVTHQADAVHSGHAKVRGLNPPLHRAWSRAFPDVVSYPVIGGGRVFVTAFTTAADGNTRESEVVAMSLRAGRVLWRRPLGRGVGGQLGLEGDRLFVTRGGYESPGVEAMSAADGHTLWRYEPNYFSAEPPVPLGGVVYVPLQDHLTAFRSSDGAALWSTGGGIGHDSSVGTPAVAGDDVWLTFACENVYRLRRSDGAAVWSHVSPCHGGGGETAALSGGRLFSREGDGHRAGYVYDAGTGGVLRGLTSTAPPAFGGGLGFFPDGFSVRNGLTLPHTLIARSVKSGRAVWRFRGDGYLDGTPLAVNDTVYVGSGSGVLYGLAARTGRVRWRDRLGTPIPASPQPWEIQTGLAAAEGTLVVPALRRVVAYR
jgi:outer membrane protein assembly factor BamB